MGGAAAKAALKRLIDGEDKAHPLSDQKLCEALAADAGFQSLSRRLQEELFLAALLHDVGKIPTTRLEDGQWVSPGHTAVARGWPGSSCGWNMVSAGKQNGRPSGKQSAA
jgi:hypothetical protein